MSDFAYLRYIGLGAMLAAGTMMSARAQTSPKFADSATSTSKSAAAPQQSDDSWATRLDRAQLKQEIAKIRMEIQADSEKLSKLIAEEENSAWAREAKAMAEAQRQKIRGEIDAEAKKLSAEAAKEMAANEMTARANVEEFSTRTQAEQADVTAQAEEKAQEARARAGQIFALAPGQIEVADDTGWLGIEVAEVTPEKEKTLNLSHLRGVIVTEVLPDSPAAKAGMQSNDVILEYDNQQVEGTVQFQRLVRETPPGRNAALVVSRNGRLNNLTVQVGDRARNIESRMEVIAPQPNFNFKFSMPEFYPGRTPALGIEAEDLSGQLGAYFHVPGGEGVLIRSVNPDTSAAKAGLKAGDVITKLDGAEIKNIGDLRDQLREKRDKKSVTLSIVRQGAQMAITVAIEPPPNPQTSSRTRTATL